MKKNKYWIIFILYVSASLVTALVLSMFVRRIPDVGQSQENSQIWISDSVPFSQEFTSKHNGLSMITVYLKNVSLRNKDDLTFTLKYSAEPIRTIKINGYNVGDGDNVPFQFDPVTNSLDQKYIFSLISPSSKENSIGVGFDQKTGSSAYQTFYTPISKIQLIKDSAINIIKTNTNLELIVYSSIIVLVAYIVSNKLFNSLS